MAFQVFDNNRPADTNVGSAGENMTKGFGWDNSKFESKALAYNYAYSWLGDYKPNVSEQTALNCGMFDKPYVYSGGGDVIQIKEVK